MEACKPGSKTAHAWLIQSKQDGVPVMRAACGLICETAKLSKALKGTRQCGRCEQYLPPRTPGLTY